MATFLGFCEKHGIDPARTLELVVGEGGGVLPQKISFQGYFGHLTDSSIVFMNDVLGVCHEIPFSSFTEAEFGVGSAQLWLQCVADGRPLVFCMRRKHWKSPLAKELLKRIGEHTEVLGWKEYDGYTGKKFLLYVFK